jgi:phospholipase C
VPITLWQRVTGQQGFAQIATQNTNASGFYQFKLAPGWVTTNRYWYTTSGTLRSPIITEHAYASVSLTSSVLTVFKHHRVTVRGQVNPILPGATIRLQQRKHLQWTNVGTLRVNGNGGFSVTRRFNRRGLVLLRAALQGASTNLDSVSPQVGISVGPLRGIHKIRHVVIIMQENRSFDSYFGTYPGADGIPPGICVPDPKNGGCIKPYHEPSVINTGGSHTVDAAIADINGGKMDGFVQQAEYGRGCGTVIPDCSPCVSSTQVGGCQGVMAYHDAREIPNYWKYAHHYVLQDHMFEPIASWSLPSHLYQVSGWSAACQNPLDAFTCRSSPEIVAAADGAQHYGWTDLTYLLHQWGVSWRYYVFKGNEPDCANDAAITCRPVKQGPTTPGIWNPLVSFTTVQQDGQVRNVQSITNFFKAAKRGTLPAVSWVTPNSKVSEHPPGSVAAGQTYVTGLVNAVMRSKDWNSTAIFIAWDDWGGFYDHVRPPAVDGLGYGIRVPGLLISPYARKGFIDHQTLSFDAFNKFIEDAFLGGQRLSPATDGRPDPRPDVRESLPILGNLVNEFNFSQQPRNPYPLPLHPRPGRPSKSR